MANDKVVPVVAEGIKTNGLSSKQFIHLAQRMYQAGCANAQPLMIHGPPGIGKTDSIKKLAEVLFESCLRGESAGAAKITKSIKQGGAEPEVTTLKQGNLEFQCIVISAPLLEPTDVKGVPAIDLEKKLAYWIEPYFLPKEGPGLILIDDLTAATRSVVSSLLMLIQHRRVLQYKLPENVMVIAAGNRVEDLSYCDQLSAAMRSRMTHIDFVPDFNEWVEWAYSKSLHSSIIGFLRFKGGSQYFHTTEKEMGDNTFACPRTWEHASNLMKLGLPRKILREAIMGSVGNAAGNEFMMFTDVYEKLPDIKEVMAHPDTALVPKSMDALYAISTAVAEQAKFDQHHLAIIKYAKRLDEEFQIITIGDALKVNFSMALKGGKLHDGKTDYGGFLEEFVKTHEKVLLSHRQWSKAEAA